MPKQKSNSRCLEALLPQVERALPFYQAAREASNKVRAREVQSMRLGALGIRAMWYPKEEQNITHQLQTEGPAAPDNSLRHNQELQIESADGGPASVRGRGFLNFE